MATCSLTSIIHPRTETGRKSGIQNRDFKRVVCRMGAAASIGSTPEEIAANKERLLKDLAGEYEALRQAGISDAEIATKLEEAIKHKAPQLWTSTTVTAPSPLKSRVIIDYDVHTGHKIVTQVDEIVPVPPAPAAGGEAEKPAPQPEAATAAHAASSPHASGAEMAKVIAGTAKTVEAIRNQHSNRFLVAIDGSDTAHQAFLTALRLRKGTDTIELVHFYDPQNEAKLPGPLKPAALKERYEVELVSKLPADKYKLTWLEKGSLTTRALVVGYVNEQADSPSLLGPRLSFLVMGYTGRRGPGEAPQLMGSVADLTLRAAHVPTLIVKTAPPEPEEPRVFMVAVDEAERSFSAYLTTLLLARPKDRIVVLHIYDDSGVVRDGVDELMTSPSQRVANLKNRYETDMKERGLVSASFVSMPYTPGTSIHDTILNFSLEQSADLVVVAPRPKEKLSSVAEHLISKGKKANVLVVKSS